MIAMPRGDVERVEKRIMCAMDGVGDFGRPRADVWTKKNVESIDRSGIEKRNSFT